MFKVIIILYFSCCLGYFLLSIFRRRKNGILKSLVITLVPFLGFLFVLYLNGLEKHSKTTQGGIKLQVLEDNITKTPFIVKTIDVESEINFVPMLDALLLNENKVRRNLLIYSLKENSVQNPKIIKQALKNDDTETSHYAATALMELHRNLLNDLQEFSGKLSKSPEDTNLLISYAEAIKKYLDSGFLNKPTFKQYQSLYSQTLERIIANNKGSKQHFMDKINCDLELGFDEKVQYFCNRFLEEYPLDEMPYIMEMKIYYKMKNKDELQQVIRKLKKLPIQLSAESLSTIRYWTQGD